MFNLKRFSRKCDAWPLNVCIIKDSVLIFTHSGTNDSKILKLIVLLFHRRVKDLHKLLAEHVGLTPDSGIVWIN